MKDYFVRIAYNSDTDIWEEIDEELNSELIEISKAPLALYKKAKFLEKENLRYKTQIESGELCNREEVRKETAREILKSMLNKMYKLTGCGVPYHVKKFIEEVAMEYGVEIFGNSADVGDEE